MTRFAGPLAIFFFIGLSLLSCAPDDHDHTAANTHDLENSQSLLDANQAQQAIPPPNTAPSSVPLDRQFQDVLNEFMGLNERLDLIASRIKSANADICARTEVDIGITIHTLKDYPEELRPAAQYYLNVGTDMSVRTVRAQSAAKRAGLRAGDRITHINGESLIDGPLFSNPELAGPVAKALFHTALDKTPNDTPAIIQYRRGAQSFTSHIPITQQCKLPVILFFSEDINGHYIDGEIWMTSGLLRNVRDDTQVAYIMAHEMAHALEDDQNGDGTVNRSPSIELEADRVGLILLARAGYEPEKLATFWAQQLNFFDGGEHGNESHPTLKKRANNYALTLSYIQAAQNDRDKLKDLIATPE